MEKNTSLAKAINKNVRTSPRKLALLCNFIKGKRADVALRDLEFSRKRISKDVSKTNQIKEVGQRISSAVDRFMRTNNMVAEANSYKWEFNLVEDKTVIA